VKRQPTLLPTLVLLGRAASGLLPPTLGLAGLTLLVIAAFTWCAPAGYAAAGIACLVTAVYVEQWRGAADAGADDQQPVVQRGTPGPFTPDGP
jgi:hypothetical protein